MELGADCAAFPSSMLFVAIRVFSTNFLDFSILIELAEPERVILPGLKLGGRIRSCKSVTLVLPSLVQPTYVAVLQLQIDDSNSECKGSLSLPWL